MVDIKSLRSNVEESLGRLRKQVTEADGKGVGSGETDTSFVKAQLRKGEEILKESWEDMPEERIEEIRKWHEDLLKESEGDK